jgi:excisionase family DNA binding protein
VEQVTQVQPVEHIELLTVKEAALRFRMHPNTIRRLLRDGYLRGERIGGQWRLWGEYVGNETHQNESKCIKMQH